MFGKLALLACGPTVMRSSWALRIAIIGDVSAMRATTSTRTRPCESSPGAAGGVTVHRGAYEPGRLGYWRPVPLDELPSQPRPHALRVLQVPLPGGLSLPEREVRAERGHAPLGALFASFRAKTKGKRRRMASLAARPASTTCAGRPLIGRRLPLF